MTDEQLPYYFAIYRQLMGQDQRLIHVTPFDLGCRIYHFDDRDPALADGATAKYEVRALDRFHRQSTRVQTVLP
ncbi:MAG: hypothetical protein HC821_01455 [Lewinella sp.]|nr:hypothetical protein [Lewinella sp.]